ncbi:S-adenosyl-L-methionine-dependent methyltransferase [Aspergillus avenaceus]|uniref:S-adenosyl-L-methionine-dependent methyltransferase n=1 Tax=Aspergillus avenaceus TaxID=36643 RepID=A0A5N6TVW0_ASPAV|nr:S-adenosyl-L-methionine-dependent methyltransferase [Aspergillus avenaceus]
MAHTDDYVLGRSLSDSVRLDAQHLLWKLHTGHTLHPQIPIADGMKVAEIGTGTGIWIFDLAKDLPRTAQLHGFDISQDQFPSRALWPPNVSLRVLNSLVDPPPSLAGRYDVVHVRMWASNIKDRDFGPLISHVLRLLKPGGYVQWEEADLVHQVVEGARAQQFGEKVPVLFGKVGLDYRWASDIHHRLQKARCTVLRFKRGRFQSFLAQKCTETYLLALAEIFRGIRKSCTDDLLPLLSECEADLQELSALHSNKGVVYNWSPIEVLARKGE